MPTALIDLDSPIPTIHDRFSPIPYSSGQSLPSNNSEQSHPISYNYTKSSWSVEGSDDDEIVVPNPNYTLHNKYFKSPHHQKNNPSLQIHLDSQNHPGADPYAHPILSDYGTGMGSEEVLFPHSGPPKPPQFVPARAETSPSPLLLTSQPPSITSFPEGSCKCWSISERKAQILGILSRSAFSTPTRSS